MNKKEKIEDIFRNDPFSLLETEKASTTGSGTEDQRLIESFGSISNFYEEHGREPLSKHFAEFRLHARLKALRNDPKKIKLLLPYDFHNLLQADVNKSYSVDEIVKDDPLGILDDNKESEDIFQLKHVTKSNRIRPDYISHRKVCPDFDEYESMFNCLHEELKKGNRKLVEFNEKDVEVGRFYVLNGVVLYLANADTVVKSESFNSGNRKRLDGRTRCIFDNGTESEMLLRSLNKALQLDGFGISELLDLNNPKTTIEGDDRQNGFIYILRSKSRDPQISKKSDLYKIGYSTGDVTQRIKNAPHEPTYLMSNVEIVSMFRCYNLSTGKLESTIHGFFNEVRCEIQVTDNEGKVCNPREWFVAPIEVIEEAVTLIVNNKIHSYRYSPNTRKIILKEL
jgi:hypothetical protein